MARDSSKTRRRLIAAADGLFYGQGIRAVGVDAVAEAAALARQLMILLDGAVAQILIHREPSYALSAADAASTLLKRTNKSKKRRSAQPSTTMTEGS